MSQLLTTDLLKELEILIVNAMKEDEGLGALEAECRERDQHCQEAQHADTNRLKLALYNLEEVRVLALLKLLGGFEPLGALKPGSSLKIKLFSKSEAVGDRATYVIELEFNGGVF